MSDQARLPYLNACIQELQRIATLFPLGPQHTVLEDTTIDGYRIPKGTIVISQLASISLDEAIYPGKFNCYKKFLRSLHKM